MVEFFQQQDENPHEEKNFMMDSRQEMDPALILKLVSGTDILTEIIYKLNGFAFDDMKGEWVSISEPLMNKEGINAVVSLLNFIVSKNTSMSGIEDWVIENIAEEFNFNLNGMFFIKGEEYGIKEEYYSALAHMIASTVYIGLRRGRVGKDESLGTTLKFLKSTFVEQHSFTTPQPDQKKKGILGIFRRGNQ